MRHVGGLDTHRERNRGTQDRRPHMLELCLWNDKRPRRGDRNLWSESRGTKDWSTGHPTYLKWSADIEIQKSGTYL